MTSPFQSIIGTPENAVEDQVERNECNSYSEEVAEVAALSFAPDQVETGICAAAKNAAVSTALPPQQRKPLRGGAYSPDRVLELLNSHYLIGKSEQEVAIFRIKDDGSLAFTPLDQFKLDVANIFVQQPGRSSPIPAEKFWKENPQRHQGKIVFKPGGTCEPNEYNLWQGQQCCSLHERQIWKRQAV